jgi:hypothetical protein
MQSAGCLKTGIFPDSTPQPKRKPKKKIPSSPDIKRLDKRKDLEEDARLIKEFQSLDKPIQSLDEDEKKEKKEEVTVYSTCPNDCGLPSDFELCFAHSRIKTHKHFLLCYSGYFRAIKDEIADKTSLNLPFTLEHHQALKEWLTFLHNPKCQMGQTFDELVNFHYVAHYFDCSLAESYAKETLIALVSSVGFKNFFGALKKIKSSSRLAFLQPIIIDNSVCGQFVREFIDAKKRSKDKQLDNPIPLTADEIEEFASDCGLRQQLAQILVFPYYRIQRGHRYNEEKGVVVSIQIEGEKRTISIRWDDSYCEPEDLLEVYNKFIKGDYVLVYA